MRAAAGRLYVKFRRMSTQLASMLNDEAYQGRSVELFDDLDGRGPYLKAVSFLGAMTPAVRGMEPVGQIAFSEDEAMERTTTRSR